MFSISLRMLSISRKAIVPPSAGDTTQLATIWVILSHFTASTPMPAMVNPTMAPMMECVVDTGQPLLEAIISQMAAASSAASMP